MAAKTATISVKLPQDEKSLFEADCSSIGLSPSALIQSFIHFVTTRGYLPKGMLEPDPFYSEANQAWLQKAQKSLDEGRVHTFTMDQVEKMLEDAINNRN
jgi:antitoxin component of RelBE/YafQ-DinJ toxin-antitoxin module